MYHWLLAGCRLERHVNPYILIMHPKTSPTRVYAPNYTMFFADDVMHCRKNYTWGGRRPASIQPVGVLHYG
jgi:hypothetical protein